MSRKKTIETPKTVVAGSIPAGEIFQNIKKRKLLV